MSFSQGFDQIPELAAEAFLGQETDDSQLRRYGSGVNQNPQRAEAWTIQATGNPADTDGVVTFAFDGSTCTVSFNTGAAPADAAAVATILADAINSEPTVRGWVTAVAAADIVTITANRNGVLNAFTPSHAEAFLGAPVQTQSAQDAERIPFGRAVARVGFSQGFRRQQADPLVALMSSDAFVAQVQTLTVDAGAAGDRVVTVYAVSGNQKTKLGSAEYAGNATPATEAGNLEAAINAAAPANTVNAVAGGADVVVTAELAGLEFVVETTAGGTSSAETTGPDFRTSASAGFAGISSYSLNDEAEQIAGREASYAPNKGVRYMQTGSIAVAADAGTVSGGERAYVDLTPGPTAGRIYPTDGAGRVLLDRRVASWLRPTGDGLDFAVLNLAHNGA